MKLAIFFVGIILIKVFCSLTNCDDVCMKYCMQNEDNDFEYCHSKCCSQQLEVVNKLKLNATCKRLDEKCSHFSECCSQFCLEGPNVCVEMYEGITLKETNSPVKQLGCKNSGESCSTYWECCWHTCRWGRCYP